MLYEVITDVEKQQREPAFVPLAAADLAIQLLAEVTVIEQSGQRVAVGHVRQLGIHALQLVGAALEIFEQLAVRAGSYNFV